MTVEITLALPPRILAPNVTVASRGGRMAKAAATKKYRTAARLACMTAFNASFKPRWTRAVVQVTWHQKTAMFPDGDNALSTCKAGFDGLADYGLFSNDRHITHQPVIFQKLPKVPKGEQPKEEPRIVIKITT